MPIPHVYDSPGGTAFAPGFTSAPPTGEKNAAEWAAMTPEEQAEQEATRAAAHDASLPDGANRGEEYVVLREDEIQSVIGG
ncbi:hypothetical protein ACFYST_00615 [Kitasatospora sp. NPDC004614]|uniref:hypothetical protein n=1 Tax=unclassified Kitasatospora TaxID=2633591 RepID=UPI0036C0EEAF